MDKIKKSNSIAEKLTVQYLIYNLFNSLVYFIKTENLKQKNPGKI